jgi:regulator of RNase E activity RraA
MTIPVFAASAAAPASFGLHHAADTDLPIACGDVAVYPGDVLVGDGEGVQDNPPQHPHHQAPHAAEHERHQPWILDEIKGGKTIYGTYPPDDETRARYEAARKSGG